LLIGFALKAVSVVFMWFCSIFLRQVLRGFYAAFSLAAVETSDPAAVGDGAVSSTTNHPHNKSLKRARYTRWTRLSPRRLALR
jgi:hypothetical protein